MYAELLTFRLFWVPELSLTVGPTQNEIQNWFILYFIAIENDSH